MRPGWAGLTSVINDIKTASFITERDVNQANKDIAGKFLKALGQGDSATVDSLLTDDCVAVCTGSSIVSRTRSRDEIVRTANYFKRTMKEGVRFEILTMTAEDDRVSVESEGFSELKNGVAYNNQYHFLFFFRDGKVCKLKEYMDTKLADEVMRPVLTSERR